MLGCVLLAGSVGAANRELVESRKVELGQSKRESHKFFQAESVSLVGTYTQRGRPVDLSATNIVVVWEINGWGDYTNTYAISTGTVSSASNVVTFALTPNTSNLTPSNYLGFVRALQRNGTNLVEVAVLSYQTIAVEWSPDSRHYNLVGPITCPGYFTSVDFTNVMLRLDAVETNLTSVSNAAFSAFNWGDHRTGVQALSNDLARVTARTSSWNSAAGQIAAVTNNLVGLSGQFGEVVDSLVYSFGSPLVQSGFTNGRPMYLSALDAGSTFMYFDGARWAYIISGDEAATNSATSYFPPSTNWFGGSGIGGWWIAEEPIPDGSITFDLMYATPGSVHEAVNALSNSVDQAVGALSNELAATAGTLESSFLMVDGVRIDFDSLSGGYPRWEGQNDTFVEVYGGQWVAYINDSPVGTAPVNGLLPPLYDEWSGPNIFELYPRSLRTFVLTNQIVQSVTSSASDVPSCAAVSAAIAGATNGITQAAADARYVYPISTTIPMTNVAKIHILEYPQQSNGDSSYTNSTFYPEFCYSDMTNSYFAYFGYT